MSSKTDFTLRWIWGSLVGWFLAALGVAVIWCGLGEIITDVTTRYFRGQGWTTGWMSDALFMLLALMALAYGGATIGFAQWQIALKGQLGKWLWIATSAIVGVTGIAGLFVGFRIVTPIPSIVVIQEGVASGFDDRFVAGETWLIGILILGISFGVACGVPQWFVLRRSFHRAKVWILVVVAASILMFLSFLVIVYVVQNAVIDEALIAVIGPIVFGAVTGPVLYDLLQSPKANT